MYFWTWYKWVGLALYDFAVCGHNVSWGGNTDCDDCSSAGGHSMRIMHLFVFAGGLLFGFGLAFGGMAKQEIVLSFLQLKDLGLLLLLGASAFVTAIAINLVPKILKEPLLGGEFKKRKRVLNKRTIIGAVIFGVGWGISGQCPGSAWASLGVGNIPVLIGIASMFIGAYIMGRFFT
jgi:uncharacterized membrane protein YedE/YeeE